MDIKIETFIFRNIILFFLVTVAAVSILILQSTSIKAMNSNDSGESSGEQTHENEEAPLHVYLGHFIKNDPQAIIHSSDLQERLLHLIYFHEIFFEYKNLFSIDNNFLKKAEKDDKYAWLLLDDSPQFLNDSIIKWISFRAFNEDACALYNLSLIYERGVGLEKSTENAFYYLCRASAKGFARAQNHLGIECRTNRKFKQALGLFKKSSNQGFVTAHFNLANYFSLGEGGEKDFDLAFKYWVLAARFNEPRSKDILKTIISLNEKIINPVFKPYLYQNMLFDFEQTLINPLILNNIILSASLKIVSEDLLIVKKCLTTSCNRPGFLINCMDFKPQKECKNSNTIRYFGEYLCFGEDNVMDGIQLFQVLKRLEEDPIKSIRRTLSKNEKGTEGYQATRRNLKTCSQKIREVFDEVIRQVYRGEGNRNRNFIDEYGYLFK